MLKYIIVDTEKSRNQPQQWVTSNNSNRSRSDSQFETTDHRNIQWSNQADIYSRRQWRRIQHLANEFCFRWKNEFLSTLQSRQKWNDLKKNIGVGDIVLLKTNNTNQNECPMGWAIEKMPDKDGIVRSVKLRIGSKNNSDETLIRPIKKLVLLVKNEDVQFLDGET